MKTVHMVLKVVLVILIIQVVNLILTYFCLGRTGALIIAVDDDTTSTYLVFGGKGTNHTVTSDYPCTLNDVWICTIDEAVPPYIEWSWVSGEKECFSKGVFGAKDAYGDYVPGSRAHLGGLHLGGDEVFIWGGIGEAQNGDGFLNDGWVYDISTTEWKWVTGSLTNNGVAVYGNDYNDNNIPGSRSFYNYLGTGTTTFLVFGGWGYNDNNDGLLNDVWTMNDSFQWKKISGSTELNVGGAYGDDYSVNNYPGSRTRSVVWYVNDDEILMFGGKGFDIDENIGYVWMFKISTFEWKFLKGSKEVNQKGHYGHLEHYDNPTQPGGREQAIGIKTVPTEYVLFGGFGLDYNSTQGYLNDLFIFNIQQNQWKWSSGSNDVLKNNGKWGTIGVHNITNVPSGRTDPTIFFKDELVSYIIGGFGDDSIGEIGRLSDLWKIETYSFCFENGSNVECSGHGTCQDMWRCECEPNYFGPSCGDTSCHGINSTKPNVCSAHGLCYEYNTCECEEYYFRYDCYIYECFGRNHTEPGVCGFGVCDYHDHCLCDGGYGKSEDQFCDSPICYDKHGGFACGEQGECTFPDVCECNDDPQVTDHGIYGIECQEEIHWPAKLYKRTARIYVDYFIKVLDLPDNFIGVFDCENVINFGELGENPKCEFEYEGTGTIEEKTTSFRVDLGSGYTVGSDPELDLYVYPVSIAAPVQTDEVIIDLEIIESDEDPEIDTLTFIWPMFIAIPLLLCLACCIITTIVITIICLVKKKKESSGVSFSEKPKKNEVELETDLKKEKQVEVDLESDKV